MNGTFIFDHNKRLITLISELSGFHCSYKYEFFFFKWFKFWLSHTTVYSLVYRNAFSFWSRLSHNNQGLVTDIINLKMLYLRANKACMYQLNLKIPNFNHYNFFVRYSRISISIWAANFVDFLFIAILLWTTFRADFLKFMIHATSGMGQLNSCS